MTDSFRLHADAAVKISRPQRKRAPVRVTRAAPAAMALARSLAARTPDTWVRVDRDGTVYVLNRAARHGRS